MTQELKGLSQIENIELREFLPKLFLAFNDSKGKNYELALILIERGLNTLFLKYVRNSEFRQLVCRAFYTRHRCSPFFIANAGEDAEYSDPRIMQMLDSALSQTEGRLMGFAFGMPNIDDEF